MRWSHIDREKRVIRLTADMTKEKRAKIIPMNHHVKRVLAGIICTLRNDFGFLYQNEPIKTTGGLKNSFIAACGKAGIIHGQKTPNGVTFHDIRRTVKTNMLSAGVDKVYRDMILGHSLHGMDVHYMSPSIDDLHLAMERYTEWLDGQQTFASVAKSVGQKAKKGPQI